LRTSHPHRRGRRAPPRRRGPPSAAASREGRDHLV